MKIKLTVVVAALVAVGLLFFQQGRADTPRRAGSTDTETAVLPPVTDTDTDTAAEENVPAVETTTAESTRVFRVRGVFHWRGDSKAKVKVRIRARDAEGVSHVEPIELAVAVKQEFDIVVDPLFEDRVPATLELEYEHAAAQSGLLKIPVRIDPKSKTPGFDRVEITLRSVTAFRGRVRDKAGAALVGATLAAFPLHNGKPEDLSVAHVIAAADGNFTLRVPGSGPHLIVAVAHGYRPVSRTIDVNANEPTRMPPFELDRGQAVGGRVTLTGARPAAKAAVWADLLREGVSISIPDSEHNLLFLDGGVEHETVFATADEDGRFRIAGLLEADYEIFISSVPGGHPGLTHSPSGPMYTRQVRAPLQGVDFEVAVGTVVMTVRHAGEPVENAKLSVTRRKRSPAGESIFTIFMKTDASGRRKLMVDQDVELTIKVEADGLRQQTRNLHAPDAGRRIEVDFDLRRTPRTELLVSLEPEGEEPPPLPPVWRFTLRPASETESAAEMPRHTATFDKGLYRIKNLEPGRYRVTGYPGAYDVRRRGHYFAASADVTITAGAPTLVTLKPRAGSRLSVLYTTADKRTDVPAFCWVETLDGKRMKQRWFKYDGSSERMWESSLPDMRGPAFARDILEPGTYRVHLKPYADGAAEMTREVEFEAGKTTLVEFGP